MFFNPEGSMKHVFAVLALACLLVGLAVSASGADQVTTVPVQFTRGTSDATLKGHFSGYDSMHYTVGAKAGQSLSVKVTGSPNANFNVYKPGDEPGAADAIGSGSTGSAWKGTLPADGEYIVQVYQMRASARRGDKVDFAIQVAVH